LPRTAEGFQTGGVKDNDYLDHSRKYGDGCENIEGDEQQVSHPIWRIAQDVDHKGSLTECTSIATGFRLNHTLSLLGQRIAVQFVAAVGQGRSELVTVFGETANGLDEAKRR
jgi:hypothetical protein